MSLSHEGVKAFMAFILWNMSRLHLNKIQHFLLISILFHFSLIVTWACFTSHDKNSYEVEVFLLKDVRATVKESSRKIQRFSEKSHTLLKQGPSPQSLTVETVKDGVSDFSSEILYQDSFQSGDSGSLQSGGKEGKAKETMENIIVDTEFGSINGPRFIYREIPSYPQIARRLGKEGRVVLRLTINERGEVVNIEVIESAPYGFTESAVDAVKKSRFSPAMKDGKPVTCRAILPVRFILKN